MDDRALLSFRRQFYQLIPAARFNFSCQNEQEAEILQAAIVQTGLFEEPDVALSYRLSILKAWMRHLDRQGFQVDERLVEWYATSLNTASPSGAASVPGQEIVNVRYHYTPSGKKSITLSESPRILTSHGTTGHRTWEAALALGDFLLHRGSVKGNVIELGAGTGFVSVLCAKLGAASVLATDGSANMVELLETNVKANDVQDKVSCEQLWFGAKSEIENRGFDLILGADITYDEAVVGALVETLTRLLAAREGSTALIFATIRQEAT